MISLIVSTRNRFKELERFLASLDRQSYRSFELLIIDQNDGDGVPALLREHTFECQYFRSEIGAARGRNLGLRVARGDIIGIPDDDCWYAPELLRQVATWFDQHPEYDLLCILECNERGEAMVPKAPLSAGPFVADPIGLRMIRSVWIAQSSMVFMRRQVRDTIGVLNETIGVGASTKYQSGEETDYFLRALHAGFRMWFEPSISVFHVELRELARLQRTTYPYALGMGYTLRLNGFGLAQLFGVLARTVGGGVLNLCKGKMDMAALYLKRTSGIVVGYLKL